MNARDSGVSTLSFAMACILIGGACALLAALFGLVLHFAPAEPAVRPPVSLAQALPTQCPLPTAEGTLLVLTVERRPDGLVLRCRSERATPWMRGLTR